MRAKRTISTSTVLFKNIFSMPLFLLNIPLIFLSDLTLIQSFIFTWRTL